MALGLLFSVAVKEMGSEFVLGYIQAMDGEKDPRNIVIAFNSVHRIVMHLSFGEQSGKEHSYSIYMYVWLCVCFCRGVG